MRPRARPVAFALVLPLALVLAGCGDDEVVQPTETPPASGTSAAAPPKRASANAGPPEDAGAAPAREVKEGDLVESERSRDPFRSFEQLFASQAKARAPSQRVVLIDRYALDELKLTGIVTRGAPKALFIDPTGLGWVVKVGDFVGRPEVVQLSGPSGADVALNWRVERIRADDVVFVREDPSHPEIAPTTRVVALYPAEEATPRR